MKIKKILASVLSLFTLFNTMPVYAVNNVELNYALAETDGEIIFHLDTTSIVYDDENLEKDINYHITTVAGNYYLDNEAVKNYYYFVEAEDASLSDSHGSNVTIPVEFDNTNSEGTLDLTKTVNDNTTYTGAIKTAIEKEEKAGTYVGRTTVLFDAFIPLMSEDTGFSFINREEESIITDYDSDYGSDVVIPEELNEKTVTKIGDQALMSKNLTSVSLSSGVKSIGNEALANNSELSNIELNEGLESIGDRAMSNTAIEEIVIPSTVTNIGNEALKQETPKLTKIVNKTNNAFNWSNITTGTNDNEFVTGDIGGVSVIDSIIKATDGTCFTYTVENNEATITGYDVACGGTDVIVPEQIDGYTVTKIGRTGLYNKGLTSVEIPGTVKLLDEYAVARNPLKSITLNEGLQTIGKQAFMQSGATSPLTTIEIPGTVETIGFNSFSKNTNLTTVKFNEGLKTIDQNAFEGCNLTSVTLPSTVKSVGGFTNNPNLTDVTLNEGLETIGKQAFGATGITKIVIPSTVTAIEERAFASTPALSTVTLNEGLQTLGKKAFFESGLTSIEIPSTIKIINEETFRDNHNLTTVKFNEGLVEIKSMAFYNTALANVTTPSTLTTIGDRAFANLGVYVGMDAVCEFAPGHLKTLTLNEGLEVIGNQAFGGNALTEITIPSTVTAISIYNAELGTSAAFAGEDNITKVVNKTGKAFDWVHVLEDSEATNTEEFTTGEINWSNYSILNKPITYVVAE